MKQFLFKMFSLTAVVLALGAWANAETPAPGGGKGDRKEMMEQRLEKMKSELQLTDDQMTKLKAIFESHKGEGEKIKDDTVLTKEEKMKQFMDMKEKVDGEINAILTPDQQAKFKEIREKMKGKMGEGHKGKPEGKPEGDKTCPAPAPAQ